VSRVLSAVLIAALAVPQAAIAAPPEGPAEAEDEDDAKAKDDPVGTLSQQGTRRGALELGLGVVLTGTAAGLVAFGAVQYVRAREHVEFCNREPTLIDEVQDSSKGIDPCVFDPPSLGFASAGLSWTFSAALLVGAGLLFARGARVLADARRYDRLQLSLSPWWQRGGGGASLALRF
jgi:hypothetical protein